jgi:hypothetical protein
MEAGIDPRAIPGAAAGPPILTNPCRCRHRSCEFNVNQDTGRSIGEPGAGR